MNKDLKERSKKFALEILKISDLLPENKKGRTISNQIIRSGTSVGANYRAACRARSQADSIISSSQ
ncbi:MAG TPA: four helix bundle protein [Bacteroidales bacterium]|nr:four helix bundle protein [Bacteroidales bacterium]